MGFIVIVIVGRHNKKNPINHFHLAKEKIFQSVTKGDDQISALLNDDEIDALFDLNKVMININKIYKRLGLTT